MDKAAAKKLAKDYLIDQMIKQIQLGLQLEEASPSEAPIYGFNPDDQYLFSYRVGTPTKLGGSSYVSVSRTTGKVHDHGVCGV